MKPRYLSALLLACASLTAFLFTPTRNLGAQSNQAIHLTASSIGGVVTSSKGPEAGVWVIAETTDLPTKYAKVVVTDDQGRYLIPDLPKANYKVWARGYGVLDSHSEQSEPGATVNIKTETTADPRTDAMHYPAVYWYSMLKVPAESEFADAATRASKGISERSKTQPEWLHIMKTDGCGACHQVGDRASRELPTNLGTFKTTQDAWRRRLDSGQAGVNMITYLVTLGQKRALDMFADWTDRIAAGEIPKASPSRPQGIERNVVITMWDWVDAKAYLHDEISTDKLNPQMNANGLVYGSPELSTDMIPVLDPVHNSATSIKLPVRDRNTPSTSKIRVPEPSPYWGSEPIWNSQGIPHNPMFDNRGRIWFTSRIRPGSNPDFCKAGSSHPSAKLTPLATSDRQLSNYDPKTKQWTLIDTCFATQHLNFTADANHTLWLSPGPPGGEGSAGGTRDLGVVGWLNTKTFDATHDEQKSQGWTALVVDTNGNGKRDDYTEEGVQPLDPSKDRRIYAWFYGVVPSPTDGSIWGSVVSFPGRLVRLTPGANPPDTALAEIYEVPWDNPKAQVQGFSPRGLDIDRNGVVWTVLASGHLASFDRRKCKGPLNGPTATGQHCPEGWTLYPLPVPQLENVKLSGSAEYPYYVWVDQFNTFGLGANTPIATGNGSDALYALVNGKFVTLRVPYPIGFFAKNVDGRVDDSKTGWKGKGLWSTDGTRVPFHMEGGKNNRSKVYHFQLRPNPLAG